MMTPGSVYFPAKGGPHWLTHCLALLIVLLFFPPLGPVVGAHAQPPSVKDQVLRDATRFPPQPIVATSLIAPSPDDAPHEWWQDTDFSTLVGVPCTTDAGYDANDVSSSTTSTTTGNTTSDPMACSDAVLVASASGMIAAVRVKEPSASFTHVPSDTTSNAGQSVAVNLGTRLAAVVALPVLERRLPCGSYGAANQTARCGYAYVATWSGDVVLLRVVLPADSTLGQPQVHILDTLQWVGIAASFSVFDHSSGQVPALHHQGPVIVAMVQLRSFLPASAAISVLWWDGKTIQSQELLRFPTTAANDARLLHCGAQDALSPSSRDAAPRPLACLVVDAAAATVYVVDATLGLVTDTVAIPFLRGTEDTDGSLGDAQCDGAVIAGTDATGSHQLFFLRLFHAADTGNLSASVLWNYSLPMKPTVNTVSPLCAPPARSTVGGDGDPSSPPSTTAPPLRRPVEPFWYPTVGVAVGYTYPMNAFGVRANVRVLSVVENITTPFISDGLGNLTGVVDVVRLAWASPDELVVVAAVTVMEDHTAQQTVALQTYPVAIVDGHMTLIPERTPDTFAVNGNQVGWAHQPVSSDGGVSEPFLTFRTTTNVTALYSLYRVTEIAFVFPAHGRVSLYRWGDTNVGAVWGKVSPSSSAVSVQFAPAQQTAAITWTPDWCTGVRTVAYAGVEDTALPRVAWLGTNGSAGRGCSADVLVFLFANGSMSPDPVVCVSPLTGQQCPGCTFQMLYDAARERVAIAVTSADVGSARSLAQLFIMSVARPDTSRSLADWVTSGSVMPQFAMIADYLVYIPGAHSDPILSRRSLHDGAEITPPLVLRGAGSVVPWDTAGHISGALIALRTLKCVTVVDVDAAKSLLKLGTAVRGHIPTVRFTNEGRELFVCRPSGVINGTTIVSEIRRYGYAAAGPQRLTLLQTVSASVHCDSPILSTNGFVYITSPSEGRGSMIVVRFNATNLTDAAAIVADTDGWSGEGFITSLGSMLDPHEQVLVFSAGLADGGWRTYGVDLVAGVLLWRRSAYQVAPFSGPTGAMQAQRFDRGVSTGYAWLQQKGSATWGAFSMFNGSLYWALETDGWTQPSMLSALSHAVGIDVVGRLGGFVARYRGAGVGLTTRVGPPPTGFHVASASPFPTSAHPFPVDSAPVAPHTDSSSTTTGSPHHALLPPAEASSPSHLAVLLGVLSAVVVSLAVACALIWIATRPRGTADISETLLEEVPAFPPSSTHQPPSASPEAVVADHHDVPVLTHVLNQPSRTS